LQVGSQRYSVRDIEVAEMLSFFFWPFAKRPFHEAIFAS